MKKRCTLFSVVNVELKSKISTWETNGRSKAYSLQECSLGPPRLPDIHRDINHPLPNTRSPIKIPRKTRECCSRACDTHVSATSLGGRSRGRRRAQVSICLYNQRSALANLGLSLAAHACGGGPLLVLNGVANLTRYNGPPNNRSWSFTFYGRHSRRWRYNGGDSTPGNLTRGGGGPNSCQKFQSGSPDSMEARSVSNRVIVAHFLGDPVAVFFFSCFLFRCANLLGGFFVSWWLADWLLSTRSRRSASSTIPSDLRVNGPIVPRAIYINVDCLHLARLPGRACVNLGTDGSLRRGPDSC